MITLSRTSISNYLLFLKLICSSWDKKSVQFLKWAQCFKWGQRLVISIIWKLYQWTAKKCKAQKAQFWGLLLTDGNSADTDVFKTSLGHLKKVTTSCDQARCCQDVLQKASDLRRLEDIRFILSWKRPIYDVLKTSDLSRLEDIWFMTSWRRLIYDVLKTSNLRCFADVWFTTLWRHPIYDVLKISDLHRLEDVRFTTSWRRLICDVLKTFDLRRLNDVCKATLL